MLSLDRRWADLPLASHCQFASTSFEAMHQRLSAVLKPHRLRRLSNVPVSGIICRALLKTITFNLMRIGPAVDVRPGALDGFYLVQIPVHGAVAVHLGDDRLVCEGATAAVISPGEHLHLRWSDHCTQLIVQIPRKSIDTRVGGGGVGALRFRPAFDLSRGSGMAWRQLLDVALRAVDDDALFGRDPLRTELEDLLLSALVAAQPYRGDLHAGEVPGRLIRARGPIPYYVMRAERHMRANLAAPVSVQQLARASGVSERTLFDGFRRHRNTTPMGRLLEMRLWTARQMMLAAKSGVTVRSVATDVGIFQFGRFAKAYRRAFGELPSQTLRAALCRNH